MQQSLDPARLPPSINLTLTLSPPPPPVREQVDALPYFAVERGRPVEGGHHTQCRQCPCELHKGGRVGPRHCCRLPAQRTAGDQVIIIEPSVGQRAIKSRSPRSRVAGRGHSQCHRALNHMGLCRARAGLAAASQWLAPPHSACQTLSRTQIGTHVHAFTLKTATQCVAHKNK